MEDFNELAAFMRVAHERNFTRAAAQLGMSQSALSRMVRALEARMGVPLLTRTTRSVAPTEAGERLLSSIGPRLRDIEAELESLRAMTDRPAGSVRITTTDYAANEYVWPRVQTLLHQYPEIKIELVYDYGLSDLVADGYDIGVRLGDQVAKDMIAMRIAPDMTMSIVGSPEYLASRIVAKTPQDLTRHNCINLRLPTMNSLLAWELSKGRRELQVRVEGQLTFNNVYQMVEAALAGFGLAYVPKKLVEPHVEAGRLAWVLEDWFPTFVGHHVYYPSRHKSSRAVELVVDALKAGFTGRTR
ncbi:LysR family transcriptional regulator [Paraburkholderia sp. GV068]|jgi:DNA-binding transcriptional LysR family regulator|uniref:LysR family transcriptional regulator n=1 Tax=Paraburkholderia TaxID=1822464 RepID=UPI0006B3F025|nr:MULTISPECIES: LysR family transcriptional regulator [Paraburkholderia]ALE57094.1 LysR family transcriptional regulator [Burkholderia sp. HB1]MDR6470188.1 DNA-binding transcriptional LysR family regulator [Paraburkholderia graminis]MDR6475754.1 DNA-binding transcriptional LysR family regulator [Paraburkholderia graminis]PTR01869.1 LysR family transcriptional regulator [Paraburkholderia sp. GV072]PUB06081.1 LysR family transcriptional regulator [Paraburkholderia sp. GV068]